MKRSLFVFTALALAPVSALAADLAPARMAPAPAIVAYNPWGGFYGGFSVGWNWGDGTTVTLPQAAAGQPGFVGDTFRGPAFIAAENQFNSQATACAFAIFGCTAVDSTFALPSAGLVGREQEKGGAVITLNAGYNWQFGNFVVGVEGDLSAMNRRYESAFSGSGTADYQFNFNGFIFPGSTVEGDYATASNFASRSRMHWLTTARLRAGFAAGDFLLYATGGIAAGRNSMSASGGVTETFTETTTGFLGTATTYSASSTTTWRGSTGGGTDFGWAVGGGVEWMTGRGFSLKAEYLFYDLGDQTLLATGTTSTVVNGGAAVVTTAPTIRIRQSVDGHIFRMGLNFGFPVAQRAAAPVVAAY